MVTGEELAEVGAHHRMDERGNRWL